MKWMTLTAALMICCVSSSADAGLFDCFKRDRNCCGQEPACCAPAAPSCCAPTPVCAPAAPSCCAPTPVCAPAAPSCCAPTPVCDQPCCGQEKDCFLHRLFNRNSNRCGNSGCCDRNRGWW